MAAFPKTLKELCTPAFLYFIISMLALFIMLMQNLGNNDSYNFGCYYYSEIYSWSFLAFHDSDVDFKKFPDFNDSGVEPYNFQDFLDSDIYFQHFQDFHFSGIGSQHYYDFRIRMSIVKQI